MCVVVVELTRVVSESRRIPVEDSTERLLLQHLRRQVDSTGIHFRAGSAVIATMCEEVLNRRRTDTENGQSDVGSAHTVAVFYEAQHRGMAPWTQWRSQGVPRRQWIVNLIWICFDPAGSVTGAAGPCNYDTVNTFSPAAAGPRRRRALSSTLARTLSWPLERTPSEARPPAADLLAPCIVIPVCLRWEVELLDACLCAGDFSKGNRSRRALGLVRVHQS